MGTFNWLAPYAYERKEGNKKKEQTEISKEAIKAYQIIGKELIAMSEDALDRELRKGSIIEIKGQEK